jgi:hypothetical protein
MITSNAISNVTNIAAVKMKPGEQRHPDANVADPPHEPGNQHEAGDVETQELGGDAEQERRHEHLQDAAELIAQHECALLGGAGKQHSDQSVEARGAHQHRKIEWEVSGLRSIRSPRHAGAPAIPPEQAGEAEQEKRDRDVDGARGDDGAGVGRAVGLGLDRHDIFMSLRAERSNRELWAGGARDCGGAHPSGLPDGRSLCRSRVK